MKTSNPNVGSTTTTTTSSSSSSSSSSSCLEDHGRNSFSCGKVEGCSSLLENLPIIDENHFSKGAHLLMKKWAIYRPTHQKTEPPLNQVITNEKGSILLRYLAKKQEQLEYGTKNTRKRTAKDITLIGTTDNNEPIEEKDEEKKVSMTQQQQQQQQISTTNSEQQKPSKRSRETTTTTTTTFDKSYL